MDYKQVMDDLKGIIEEFFKKRENDFKQIIQKTSQSLNSGGKVLIFGNGGSAAQAQHFAAELVNKFLKKRAALPVLSLTTDTSALTSIANDTSFEYVFSRQVEAFGKKGDVVLGISTSGNSPNVIQGIKKAKHLGLITIALTGEGGGRIGSLPDYLLDVPSENTPRVQEAHLIILHLLAQEMEKELSQ